MIQRTLILLLYAVRAARRAFLPPSCRFEPSCSVYAEQALSRRGLLAAAGLTAARLSRCHPLHPGGYDPVP